VNGANLCEWAEEALLVGGRDANAGVVDVEAKHQRIGRLHRDVQRDLAVLHMQTKQHMSTRSMMKNDQKDRGREWVSALVNLTALLSRFSST
jgi:hypothetical protein